eukprot:4088731-Pyramimonas_sp.AAC.1
MADQPKRKPIFVKVDTLRPGTNGHNLTVKIKTLRTILYKSFALKHTYVPVYHIVFIYAPGGLLEQDPCPPLTWNVADVKS